jgi:alcohol-forming fatty acyl-CoA reductase
VSESCGLNDEQLSKVINETELVFHMAASLRLEATLRPNILMNLLGTKHMVEMCKKMPKLLLMTHLSTAFCTSDETGVLYEKVYDWKDDPAELIRCTEWMDDKTMEMMQSKLLDPHPNTYTYTKRLSEIFVRSEYKNLPLCIVRPSIGKLTFSFYELFALNLLLLREKSHLLSACPLFFLQNLRFIFNLKIFCIFLLLIFQLKCT